MSDILDQVLNTYGSLPSTSFKKGLNSLEFFIDSPEGRSRTVNYTLLPGIYLTYFDINAHSLPDLEKNKELNPLQFNYCIDGRFEVLLEDDGYVYLKENVFSITNQASKSDSFFPTGYYKGIGISFDIEFLNTQILETFDIDFSRLQEIYLDKRKTYIAEANEKIKILISKIIPLFENPSLFYMRMYVIELLHILLEGKVTQTKTCTFYTNIQIKIAKKAEHILVANLCDHIPIRFLAEQFSVSETSLKNYFRGVYGQNISDYLRNLRMETAAKLLSETKIAISEISFQIGYTKPGRFAAIFKKHYHLSPLEYRRAKRLEFAE